MSIKTFGGLFFKEAENIGRDMVLFYPFPLPLFQIIWHIFVRTAGDYPALLSISQPSTPSAMRKFLEKLPRSTGFILLLTLYFISELFFTTFRENGTDIWSFLTSTSTILSLVSLAVVIGLLYWISRLEKRRKLALEQDIQRECSSGEPLTKEQVQKLVLERYGSQNEGCRPRFVLLVCLLFLAMNMFPNLLKGNWSLTLTLIGLGISILLTLLSMWVWHVHDKEWFQKKD